MLIEFKQTVRIAAPVGAVWDFILNPEKVVNCMPGASLKEVHGHESFDGSLSVKVGAITAQFNGKITYANVNSEAHTVDMLASAKQYGGGSLTGTIGTKLAEISASETEVEVLSTSEIKGGLVRAGKGMIEAMAAEIIKDYVDNVRTALETPSMPDRQPDLPETPRQSQASINVFAILFSLWRRRLASLFRRPS